MKIQGRQQYLWRAVDQDGEVVDVFLQNQRDGQAAKRFFKRLLNRHQSELRKIVTDKLSSDGVKTDMCAGLTLITKSACKGYQPAQFSLSCLYRDGAGTPQDATQAYVWMRLASLPGDPIIGSTENLCGTALINWLPRDIIDHGLCLNELQTLASTMTSEQIDKGEEWVKRWKAELLWCTD